MAVIDRAVLQDAGLTSGDFVAIEGRDGGRTVARVWPSDSEDAGRGIVRIDGQLRREAGVGVDDALLRPGRLDRHVAVEEPDEATRREIFAVHTRDRPLADDVDLDDLTARTDGYVGADIAAVCREAAQTAVREYVDATTDTAPDVAGSLAGDGPTAVDDIVLTAEHFERALEEVAPGGERRDDVVDPASAGPA